MQKILLLFLFGSFAFSQSKTSILEDKIYNAVDIFVADPSEKTLKKLEVSEKTFNPKTKSDWLAIVILNCNKGYYQNQFGHTQEAIKSYEKAWQVFQKNKLSNYDMVESCLQPLANLYTIIGDYDNAENIIKQYFFTSMANGNSSQVYAATLNLSNVYHNTGRASESLEFVAKTLKLEKFSNIQKGVLYNNVGNSFFALNMMIPARNAYETSIRLLTPYPSGSETLSNAYRNLAKVYCVQQNFAAANLNMQKAEELFYKTQGKTPRKQAQFYYDKALLHFMQHDFGMAQLNLNYLFGFLIPGLPNAELQLPAKNSLYAETVLLDGFDLQAEIFKAKNQHKKALASYALSFHIESLLQSLLVYENSKIITQVRNRNRTEKCIDIYYSLYQKEKDISYIENAFLLSEQTKSAVLRELILASKDQSREEKLIIQQLQNWNTIIVKDQQKMEKADISKINQAIKKQNELMLLLKSTTAKKIKETKELKLADLYLKLEKDNAVMTEYFFGQGRIYVFVLENKKITLESISEAATPKLVQFIDLFNNSNTISNNPLAYNHISNEVYGILKLPKKASNKNLIIVPDGILSFLPFETLITKQGTTASFAKMHYLLHDFKIGYTNSADFYLKAIPFQHEKKGILGVFPIFEGSGLELAFSKNELKNLQDNFDGKYLDSQKASFQNFRESVANYSILHLSTHASSGDIVEPASIRFYDREVLYSEFYNLNLNPDLVVLSACETGIGKLYKAEGAMSIARGFQSAGAQNLLFSLWKVNDFTTSVLMEKFYANLKKGDSYFDSGHQAKLDFLSDESIPNAKKSPYYWGAFVYYGTLERQAETNYFLWISLLGGLIALLLLRKFVFRKK
jgi:CHAT domain-containing protein